jgi:hypothetical protein
LPKRPDPSTSTNWKPLSRAMRYAGPMAAATEAARDAARREGR